MRTPQIMKIDSPMLTLPGAPRPPLLQTRLFDMDQSADARKLLQPVRLRLRQERLKLSHNRPAVKLHDLLLLVVPPPLELVAVEQRRWAQQ